MSSRDPRSGKTAEEPLMAELEADPEYQERIRLQDAELEARAQELRIAEEPVVVDRRTVGWEVGSAWDLVNTSEPYPAALPVLLQHLEKGGYPDRVMEGLARAMAVEPAAYAWDSLCRLYLKAKGRGEMEGLAVALAASATPDNFDQLVSLLNAADRGTTRIHFLRAITRVGGQRGLDKLIELKQDRVFEKEAKALVRGKTKA